MLPALALTNHEQGALLLADLAPIDNPFLRMAPDRGLAPMAVLTFKSPGALAHA